MKVYTGNLNWADEGDIFFFSVKSEGNLKAMKRLIEALIELDLPYYTEIYLGVNKYFEFDLEDFLSFINEAKDISEKELAVLKKFKVSGFDIYRNMLNKLSTFIYDYEYGKYETSDKLTQERLDKIKPLYLKLYKQKEWDKIQQCFNERFLG